jgi:dimethylargininase
MSLIAITRAVSPAINNCELGFVPRHDIDVSKASEQHRQYERCLEELGVRVVSLPAEPDLPDSMFVEDPAVVIDELAIMTRMGAESRRKESETLAQALSRFRPLHWIQAPATLEGGDVLRVGSTLFVGMSQRTNADGIAQLTEAVSPLGYSVHGVPIRGCLHLKSACCYIGGSALLANTDWVDTGALEGFHDRFHIIDVPPDEPRAANVLTIGDTVLVPAAFPGTAGILEKLGWKTRILDISELMKAEAGLTCSSLLFEADL